MSRPAQPRVAAIILNWRGASDTAECARSLAMSDYDALDIIICDNDSDDGSLEHIEDTLEGALPFINAQNQEAGRRPFQLSHAGPEGLGAADTRYILLKQTGHNGGYAFGNNVGIDIALAAPDVRYVWVLNNDTIMLPQTLSLLVAHMEADRRIGICGGITLYLDQPDRVQTLGGGRFRPSRARTEQIGTGLHLDSLPPRETILDELRYINGAAALASRAMIDRIGKMDDGYFLYFEEIDWAEKARRQGFHLGYCDNAIVYHKVGAASGSDDSRDTGMPSPFSIYHWERSRMRFLRRWHPKLLPLAALLVLKAAFRQWRTGNLPATRAMIRGGFGRDAEHL